MRRSKVLLLGSYGQTNLGDDLLMYNMLQLLEQRGYTKVYLNISDKSLLPPEVDARFGHMIEMFETYGASPLKLLRVLGSVGAIVYGGGTIFKDLYASTGRGKHSVVMRIAIMNILARMMRVKVYHLCIGIGSIRTRTGRFLTKLALNAARHSYFRDEESYVYARDTLHISAEKITHSTDGIFIGTAWGEYGKVKLPGKSTGLTVGVNALSDIPDWVDRESYINEMCGFLTGLVDRGARIVFVPFQTAFNPHNDLTFIQNELTGGLPEESYVIYDDMKLSALHPLFTQFDLFVGMRFHSLLVSSIYSVPFLAIEYDTKCTRLIHDMQYPYSLALEKFNARDAMKQFDALQHANHADLTRLQHDYVHAQQNTIEETLDSFKV